MMIRRRVVALISALLMLGIATVTVGAFVLATQGDRGREWIRRAIEAQLAQTMQGTVHIGTLSGSFLTDLRVDSIRIADLDDSTFFASGPIEVTFDPRDLVDGRVILRTVSVERPFVAMRKDHDRRWTNTKLWPRRATARAPKRRTRFAAVTVFEQVQIRDGEFVVMMPTSTRSEGDEIQEDRLGRLTKVWRWRDMSLDLPRARIAYPDTAGLHFQIARFDAIGTEPPFHFTNLGGAIAVRNDTAHLNIPHFELPHSEGNAQGQVWWGPGLPARYDIRVSSERMGLEDIAWINESLPTEGTGTVVLDIQNTRGDAQETSFIIRAMDARSHRSRIRGSMTWDVGGPAVVLRDIDLEAMPLDVRLLEVFKGGPFDIPLRGQFIGRLRGSGGTFDRFQIDDMTARFNDGNVAGAVARAKLTGVLDISDIANATFRGADLTLEAFDLRTAQALDADFPKLNGIISGTATLDSSWLDVRLRDADITHRDGDAPVTRLRGTARVDWAREVARYELDAEAMPLSFTALAQSFPEIPLRGEYAGRLRVRGAMDSLSLISELTGAGGRFETDVVLDNSAPRYRAAGRVTLAEGDPRVLFARDALPQASIAGTAVFDVAGDSLADLVGTASVSLDRSQVEGARIFAGEARARFGEGRMTVDTLFVESSAIAVRAEGALGLTAAITDTLTMSVRVDSLGGLRPWLRRPAEDSLAGFALAEGRAIGSLRGFDIAAAATAEDLLMGGNSARVLRGTVQITGLPDVAAGEIAVNGDTLQLARFGVQRLAITALRDGSERTSLNLAAMGNSGTTLVAGGVLEQAADSVRIRFDSVALATRLQRWTLERRATLSIAGGGFAVDSAALSGNGRSQLVLAGRYPASEAIDLHLRARDLPIQDVAELWQLEDSLGGRIDLLAQLRGTRGDPLLEASGEWREGLVAGIRLDTLRAVATARGDVFEVQLALGARARPTATATATLPLALGLDGTGPGMRRDGELRAQIRADSVGLGMFEALTRGTGTRGASGHLAAAVDVTGTWAQPSLDGSLRVRDGAISPEPLGNVRWTRVEADVLFRGDSIVLERMEARSGGTNSGRVELQGWVSLREPSNPQMNLRLSSRGFNAFARPNVADVDLSGELQLTGSYESSILRGALTADRAIIAIPELASKEVISLEDLDPFARFDTLFGGQSRALDVTAPAFIQNLTIDNVPIRMGRDVWLRSSEANINLGGQVSVTRGEVTRGRDAGRLQLALDGPLQTVRGTYRLNLGPVQRTFEVEQGEIRFYGDPDNNPTLSVDALHTVRQYSTQGVRPDVRVRVHLGGTLNQPTLTLATPDSVRVTNSDLISYLVTGGPSFEIGGSDRDLSSTALTVVLGSFGSVLGGKAAGGVCDDANVSTAGLERYGGRITEVGAGVLSGIRVNCAKQVGERTFVRLDAGLCQVGQLMSGSADGNPLSFTEALGLKLDYLLSPGVSASFGVEPPTSAVLCSVNNASARGFVPTPRQFGFDLFRVWRF
jgi:translocation and assembly module TamB